MEGNKERGDEENTVEDLEELTLKVGEGTSVENNKVESWLHVSPGKQGRTHTTPPRKDSDIEIWHQSS